MTPKTVLPFGTWPSQISASLLSQGLRFNDVQWAGDGITLVWGEGRSSGVALVAQTGGEARRDLTSEQTPSGGVGYGGGMFSTALSGDGIVFANRDGRIFYRGLGAESPRPVTPAFGLPASSSGDSPRFAGVASPALSPDGKWVLYVYSDGSTDLIGLADASGSQWPTHLVRGADFYMQPAWHPAGDRVAWVEWDHPNMPWDGTRVQLASFADSPARVVEAKTVAGGRDIPAQQPMFSPDGRWLSFIEEDGEWPDLVLYNLETGQRRVLVDGAGFELSSPAWVQGVRSTGWSPDSQRVYYFRLEGEATTLWYAELASGASKQIDTNPYTSLSQLAVAPRQHNGRDVLAFTASSAAQPTQIVCWDGQTLHVAANSAAATVDPAALPAPRSIHWQTSDQATAHGLYYPPSNPRFDGEGLPPAILHIHGGPTSLTPNGFAGEAAYFTSRGYAYVEVNYRGSTGYGRAYRHAMRQRWGDVDVEDAASCARALIEQGLADAKKLVIMGGSAGGYTVLNTLIRYPGLFKAAICLYGVSNLFALDLDTHKFEKHYNASMVGHLPEAAERYQAWSPIFHAERIQDAIYVFQGADDKVVPPNQSEEIVAALKSRGVPHKYRLYEGEGHGFRKAENITDFLRETERFLQQYVLFAP